MITKELKEKLIQEKDNILIPRSQTLPQKIIDNIKQSIANEYSLDNPEQALVPLAILFQQGATARSCDGNMTITVFSKDIKLARIRTILRNNNCARGEKKLARSLANEIIEIVQTLELPGNLYPKIKRLYPERNFSIEEQCWLSDFQAYNSSTPTELNTLIIETFQNNTTPKFIRKTGK